jgi:hypothetical protein
MLMHGFVWFRMVDALHTKPVDSPCCLLSTDQTVLSTDQIIVTADEYMLTTDQPILTNG